MRDPKLGRLDLFLDHVVAELRNAIAFSEAGWPAWTDNRLEYHFGYSRAGAAALNLRLAGRNEALLAIARIWDDDATSVEKMCAELRKPGTRAALLAPHPDQQAMMQRLERLERQLDRLQRHTVAPRCRLVEWRHNYLAHRNRARADSLDDLSTHDMRRLVRISAAITSAIAEVAGRPIEPSFAWTLENERRNAEAFWTLVLRADQPSDA